MKVNLSHMTNTKRKHPPLSIFVLSFEPIMEPPIRFKDNAENYGFKKSDAITFKIGEVSPLNKIL